MKELQTHLREGHYAKKQILCKDWLISWSHTQRFLTALKVAQEFRAKRVLDYGCGDGTFLALLAESLGAPAHAVGCDVSSSVIEDCRDRLKSYSKLRFCLMNEIDDASHSGAYDLIFCMEVLEHVLELDSVFDHCDRLLTPDGRLVVSVPVETGVPLIVKVAARRLAAWRGLGDYPGSTPYSCRDFISSLFAGPRQHMTRPCHQDPGGMRFYDHTGFNWQVLQRELARRFHLQRTFGSPLNFLPPHMASQVWFVLAKNRGSE